MKVGVFTVLLADRPLEEALDYVKEAGCEAVEIGTGGYPGDAHCKPTELLARRRRPRRVSAGRRRAGIWRSAPSPATATRSTPTRRLPRRTTSSSATPSGSPQSSASGTVINLLRLPGRFRRARSTRTGSPAPGRPTSSRPSSGSGREKVAPYWQEAAAFRQAARRPGRDRASSRLRRLPHRVVLAAARDRRRDASASTSTPRTSSGRGWTRSSASANWETPSSTST